jgi:uncharacterized protein
MIRARSALIVFCREPISHRTKTRLIGKLSAKDATVLSGAFIRDALAKAVAARPARLIIACDSPRGAHRSDYFRRLAREYGADVIDQGVGSLGARMARALQPFRSGGALLIGTDTPSLPLSLLKQNLDNLRATDVVIAASLDGGYYAIGVRGVTPPIFTGIRWGTRTVFRDTVVLLKRARIKFALGPSWYDVDRWTDVLVLAAHLRLIALSKRTREPHPCPATFSVLQRLGLLGDES